MLESAAIIEEEQGPALEVEMKTVRLQNLVERETWGTKFRLIGPHDRRNRSLIMYHIL